MQMLPEFVRAQLRVYLTCDDLDICIKIGLLPGVPPFTNPPDNPLELLNKFGTGHLPSTKPWRYMTKSEVAQYIKENPDD